MAVFGHFYRCFVLTVKVAENVHFYGWACSTIKVAENGLFYSRMEKHSRNSSQYLKLDFFNFDQSETPRIQKFSEKKENFPKKAIICTVKTYQRKKWPKTATFNFFYGWTLWTINVAVFGQFYGYFVLTIKVAENNHFYGWNQKTVKTAKSGRFRPLFIPAYAC